MFAEAGARQYLRMAGGKKAEIGASRGESAYVWEEAEAYRAFVVEGLGTKSLVADATRPITGRTHYPCPH